MREGDDARVSEPRKWRQKQSAKAKYLLLTVTYWKVASNLRLRRGKQFRERAQVGHFAFGVRRGVTTRGDGVPPRENKNPLRSRT